MNCNQTMTLTFGNVAENHVGMQQIGKHYADGLSKDDLMKIRRHFKDTGYECILYHLHEDVISLGSISLGSISLGVDKAYLLVVKNGLDLMLGDDGPDDLAKEQDGLNKDTKAYQRGKVVNKRARYNLCFSDFDQEPDYENKKGTVINFNRLPLLNKVRDYISNNFPTDKVKNLQCEGNYYYDIDKTYIGFHGDSEREIVIGCRLGCDFPLHYQWYNKFQKVGDRIEITLSHGDIYIMSDKAVGYDWKKSSIYTLRHAAGFLKNISK